MLKNFLLIQLGSWLAGILKTGEIFLWNKDCDTVATVPTIEEVKEVIIAAQGRNGNLVCFKIGVLLIISS